MDPFPENESKERTDQLSEAESLSESDGENDYRGDPGSEEPVTAATFLSSVYFDESEMKGLERGIGGLLSTVASSSYKKIKETDEEGGLTDCEECPASEAEDLSEQYLSIPEEGLDMYLSNSDTTEIVGDTAFQ